MYVCHHPIPMPPITLSLYSNHSAESYLTQTSSSSPGSPPAMSAAFKAFLNSPVGPKTTHFWGPVSNWGIILASVADTKKPPEMISGNMTGVLCVYSALFVRFAWMVRPRNYFLMVTHSCNECVQLYQLSRWARAQGFFEKKEEERPKSED